MHEFTVYMEPKGKERPRFNHRNNCVFTPQSTLNAEKQIADAFKASGGVEMTGYIKLEVIAYCKVPASASKTKREEMISGRRKPAIVPDADNILKLVGDSLQGPGLLCLNDKFITSVSCIKLYAATPRLLIRISEDVHNGQTA